MSLPKYSKQKDVPPSDTSPAYSAIQQQELDFNDSAHSSPSKQSTARRHGLRHFGWWWEVSGIFFAILATVAIITILTQIDDQPISSWPYSIQPGTLVSIFSTIAKSALLVPVAVCISQLKWTYFEQPRDLSHMQVFDDASRGPLGALVLLWKTRGVAWLAGVGALVTVLVMTFEPFSQQAIHVGEKIVLLDKAYGVVWAKEDFGDGQFSGGSTRGSDVRFEFTIAMMEAMMLRERKRETTIYGQSAQCGGLECRFKDFTTLGARTQCETETIQMNSEFGCHYYTTSNGGSSDASRRNYDKFDDFQGTVEGNPSSVATYGIDCSREKKGYPTLSLNLEANMNNKTWALRGLGRPKGSSPNSTALSNDAVFGNTLRHSGDAFSQSNGSVITTTFVGSSLSFCSSSYDDGTHTEFDTIDSYSCFVTNWDPSETGKVEDFADFRGNITHCRMSMCAQEYRDVSIFNNTLRTAPIVEKPLQVLGNGSEPTDLEVTTSDKNKTFEIGSKSMGYLAQMLDTVLFSGDYKEALAQLIQKDEAGWEAVFKRLAVVASTYIRRPDIEGMDGSLTVGIPAVVYGPQTYFKVTWPWLVMPLLLVFLCIGFLVATVIHNHRKPYLFKHSVLASMQYGLKGWQSSEKSTDRETNADMERQARGVRARLMSGQDGELRFVKQ